MKCRRKKSWGRGAVRPHRVFYETSDPDYMKGNYIDEIWSDIVLSLNIENVNYDNLFSFIFIIPLQLVQKCLQMQDSLKNNRRLYYQCFFFQFFIYFSSQYAIYIVSLNAMPCATSSALRVNIHTMSPALRCVACVSPVLHCLRLPCAAWTALRFNVRLALKCRTCTIFKS